ncbi:regulatory protein RecX [Microbacterium sp. CIAB417]|uniref:regulatory protein RecX n=1 Tax=Microbacterium sp. CIAB417 TaxID=2860287 RepID=UPI001FACB40F|nr:regulatory protein RecX [Microbacterium sp. CIAB417]
MPPSEGTDEGVPDPAELAAQASEALVRKLRARSMSVAEASTFLRGLHITQAQVDEIIDEFCSLRYLDDALLAGHLVTAGHERKGQGRVALARVLAQRGIPRDIADAALEELPDDDFERALEFARTKLRGMTRLDAETAKRRLSGQLARRGYSGSVVSAVVRTAMAEQSFGRPSSGVRFD